MRFTPDAPLFRYTGCLTMRVIDSIASAFINTFGITVPSEAARRRASWFIVTLLLLTLVVVALVGTAFYRALHAGVGAH